jgi:ABC-2 type transport system ATP-binding protein
MEEAERLCNRTAIIDAGQIIAIGTLDELRSISKLRETITLGLGSADYDVSQFKMDGVELQAEGTQLHFHAHQVQSALPAIIMRCSELGLEITNLNIQKVNLETIFLKLTGKKLRD